MTILREETADLHHIVEETKLGKELIGGTISPALYMEWVGAFWDMHHKLDPLVSPLFHRETELAKDQEELWARYGVPIPPSHPIPPSILALFRTEAGREALIYVVFGSYLTGGKQISNKLRGRLPTHHYDNWSDKKATIKAWGELRDRKDLIPLARCAFMGVHEYALAIGGR